MRKKRLLKLLAALSACASVGLFGPVLFVATALAQDQPRFITIDFPGAVLTNAWGINPGGESVGVYVDTAGHQHGFLLSGGQFTSIDYPGAIATDARGINPGGDIVGLYIDSNGKQHGFLRSLGMTD